MKDMKKEQEKLEETIKVISEVLQIEKIDLEKLYKDFVGNIDELWSIADRKKIHISNLETSMQHPYFARIDFTSDDDGKTSTIYIGKNGIMRDANIIVTDWRAPISSLYYDSEIGKCSYTSPGGVVSGDMSLKRQYEIEKGKLISYHDVDLVSNDSLLQKYLNTNNDARLKSIVSTIQKEQNDVIRKKITDNLIIQGVAGSGKTTVALHRIAYLVYNYLNSIKQSQYLVIGPNPVFLKYIRSVLPELDVSGVKQCTYEEFAKEYIDEEIEIIPSNNKVNDRINGKQKNNNDKFKCSMYYKNMIDKFLEVFFESLTVNDLKIGDFVVLESKYIKQIFDEVSKGYNQSLNGRIEMTINRLCTLIEANYDKILSRYSDYSHKIFKEASPSEKEKLRTKFAKEREEINKCCKSTLRKYFSRSKVTPTKLYKLFITSINDYNIYNYEDISSLKKETLSNIKSKKYDFEDLAALIYIKKCISPNREYDKFRHVVVDEAQDLGEFNFYSLKQTLPSSTFSIFGDIAQSIYDYRGIENWSKVNDVMFENDGEIVNFNKSYRTTSEIMNMADNVSNSIGLGKSDLVVRHGNPVTLTESKEEDNIPDLIIKKLEEYKKKGYKSIAIISKTNILSQELNDKLKQKGVIIPDVSINDDLTDDKFKICTISNQLAKGLEFDAVIINNANEEIYSSQSSLDMKLLYVAITRALHELDIIYVGELTKPLQNNQEITKKLK